MQFFKTIIIILFVTSVFFLTFLFGCSNSENQTRSYTKEGPFRYNYTAPGKITVIFKTQKYYLTYNNNNKYAPFNYSWEDDGELNINHGGRRYDFDSPYDALNDFLKKNIYKKKKKKKAKVAKQKIKKNTTRSKKVKTAKKEY